MSNSRRVLTSLAGLLLAASSCSAHRTEGPAVGGAQGSPTTQAPKVAGPIGDLIEKTSMTEQAQRLFLGTDPQIVGKAELQGHCRNTSSVHVLGRFLVTQECRTVGGAPAVCSKNARIHLLRVDRADINDLIYVSAAHEMLHAAYDELPVEERQPLDRALESAVSRLEPCGVAANLGAYAGRPAAERRSELHSVLATEFASLPAGLEGHYAKYLRNRQLVVQAHDRTLGFREQEICALRSRIDQLQGQVSGLRQQLQRLRSRGNAAAHNAQVPGFNNRVNEHNRLVDAHNRKVREYNQLLSSLGSSADLLQQRQPAQAPQ